MLSRNQLIQIAGVLAFCAAVPLPAQLTCRDLPSHAQLTDTLRASVAPTGGPSNGGFDFHAWAALITRDGEVCAITKTGPGRGDQFPISRLAAVFKANAANGNSLPGLAISTAIAWANSQPGSPISSLELAGPPDPRAIYPDPSGISRSGTRLHGSRFDPLTGKIPGGYLAIAGGLALYDDAGTLVGAIGVGGDSPCADHNIAWRVREALGLDNVPFGPNPQTGDDGIVYDRTPDGASPSGIGHPRCFFAEHQVAVAIGAGSVPTNP